MCVFMRVCVCVCVCVDACMLMRVCVEYFGFLSVFLRTHACGSD